MASHRRTEAAILPRVRVGLLCLGVLAASDVDAADTVTIGANGHRLLAEVADTPEARTRGLMHRTALPADQGMLFLYPDDGHHCMWMRDTHLPLSVAFLDGRRVVLNVAEMAPQTDTLHCAARPARYVLEMPAGWFDRHGVGVGTRLDFQVPAARR